MRASSNDLTDGVGRVHAIGRVRAGRVCSSRMPLLSLRIAERHHPESETAMRSGVQVGSSGKWRVVLVLALLTATVAVFTNTASAVHDTGAFELDGNAIRQTSDDWDEVCAARAHELNGAAFNATSLCGTNTDSTAVEDAWASDGALNASIFTGGGSKDPQPIENWAWKDNAGGLPDKDNLLHAFAARYSLTPDTDISDGTLCPDGGFGSCELLYFGSDRFDNSGDAHQAFWFLQGKVGFGTNKINGGTGFSGSHVPGDVLVVSEFSNGGAKSTIKIWEWDPSCANGALGCADNNLRILSESTSAKCDVAAPGAPYCGIVNSANGTAAPWPYTDKSGNSSYLQGEFFEGGINLSTLGLADQCFSTVVAETRSSTSATATLKDFVVAPLGSCGAALTTTPSDNAGTAIPKDATSNLREVSIGTGSVQVKDSAVLEVEGTSTWSGSLEFHLCGPIATGTCSSGGTKIGTTKSVDQDTVQPIVSAAATVTEAGRYCWRGDFTSATQGLPDASDSSEGECFTVKPVTPGLSTQAVDISGAATNSVPLGSTVYDTATLSGTANKPGIGGGGVNASINPTTPGGKAGGTINFKLYGPGIANCNALAAGFSAAGIDVTVTDGNGTYGGNAGNVKFVPTVAGDYYWKASYSGNSPNTLSTSHNGDCSVASEKVTVIQLQPAISTAQSFVPNDSATITVDSGGGNLAGTVVFKLFIGATNDCSGTAAYTSSAIDITSGTGTALSRTVMSNNTTAYTANTAFKWVVTFTSSNTSHKNVTSACGTEISNIVINNSAGT